jgi:hypothetical protein
MFCASSDVVLPFLLSVLAPWFVFLYDVVTSVQHIMF